MSGCFDCVVMLTLQLKQPKSVFKMLSKTNPKHRKENILGIGSQRVSNIVREH